MAGPYSTDLRSRVLVAAETGLRVHPWTVVGRALRRMGWT